MKDCDDEGMEGRQKGGGEEGKEKGGEGKGGKGGFFCNAVICSLRSVSLPFLLSLPLCPSFFAPSRYVLFYSFPCLHISFTLHCQ